MGTKAKDGHPTTVCPVRRSYSDAAAGTFPPLPTVSPAVMPERETGAAEEIKNAPPEATLKGNEEVYSLANHEAPCPPASPARKDTMVDVASIPDKQDVSCLVASPAEKQAHGGTDTPAASLAECAVVSDAFKCTDAGVSSSAAFEPNEPNTLMPSESQARDFLEQVARRHGNSSLTRLDKQLAVKVVGGDNIDSAALPLPESSESSFSLGVDSSIELSLSLDECDVEMVAPREVKRAHTSGTSSDGAQDSRSEPQQPKKPRPSSRGPKCVV
ncbi:hypothetical protein HPB52_013281 [Rhipicephalus sanguineus]|uniref:Uncharacterized protein n=1 Tax=Rhipicephalus sanguineus TaxID=34632 RepID=A0A9D4T2F0_RHISA|nr:hypothetical protein HPB52_013281 [Rhipicephalus sanguineus]